MRQTRTLHDRADIGEVDVDLRLLSDQLAYALDTLAKYIVRLVKGVEEGYLFIGKQLKTLVGDNDKRIRYLCKALNTALCLSHSLLSFEIERLGYDTDGKDAELLCYLCDYRSCAGAGSAAHSGGDKHHVCALKRSGNLLYGFVCRLLAQLGIGSCALPFCNTLADSDAFIRKRLVEHHKIGVYGDILDSLDSGFHHAVDGVSSAAAHADDFYNINGSVELFVCHSVFLRLTKFLLNNIIIQKLQ